MNLNLQDSRNMVIARGLDRGTGMDSADTGKGGSIQKFLFEIIEDFFLDRQMILDI